MAGTRVPGGWLRCGHDRRHVAGGAAQRGVHQRRERAVPEQVRLGVHEQDGRGGARAAEHCISARARGRGGLRRRDAGPLCWWGDRGGAERACPRRVARAVRAALPRVLQHPGPAHSAVVRVLRAARHALGRGRGGAAAGGAGALRRAAPRAQLHDRAAARCVRAGARGRVRERLCERRCLRARGVRRVGGAPERVAPRRLVGRARRAHGGRRLPGGHGNGHVFHAGTGVRSHGGAGRAGYTPAVVGRATGARRYGGWWGSQWRLRRVLCRWHFSAPRLCCRGCRFCRSRLRGRWSLPTPLSASSTESSTRWSRARPRGVPKVHVLRAARADRGRACDDGDGRVTATVMMSAAAAAREAAFMTGVLAPVMAARAADVAALDGWSAAVRALAPPDAVVAELERRWAPAPARPLTHAMSGAGVTCALCPRAGPPSGRRSARSGRRSARSGRRSARSGRRPPRLALKKGEVLVRQVWLRRRPGPQVWLRRRPASVAASSARKCGCVVCPARKCGCVVGPQVWHGLAWRKWTLRAMWHSRAFLHARQRSHRLLST